MNICMYMYVYVCIFYVYKIMCPVLERNSPRCKDRNRFGRWRNKQTKQKQVITTNTKKQKEKVEDLPKEQA